MMLETQGDWASEVAQLVKVIATKPGDLSLILKTEMVKGSADSLRLSSDFYTGAMDCTLTHIYRQRHGQTKPGYSYYGS